MTSAPAHAERASSLATRWREWTEVVRQIAVKRAELVDVDGERYHQLYADLLAAIRARRSEAAPAERESLRELEELLVPWVSLESLRWADNEIVHKLLGRCRSAQASLVGRGSSRTLRLPSRRLGPLLIGVGALGLAVVVFGGLWPGDTGLGSVVPAVRGWLDSLVLSIRRLTFEEHLMLGAALVSVVAIFAVWRSTLTY
jgi:hypothetical protein